MSELTQRLQKLQDSRADFDAAQKALSGETPSAISLRDGPKYERAYKAYLDAQMAMSAEAHDFMLWATEHDAAAQTEPLSRAA